MIEPTPFLRASPRFAAETRSEERAADAEKATLVKTVTRRIGLITLIGAIAVAPLGCDDDDEEFTGPSNAPASHTVSKDGVRHLPGLTDPETNCVACHGADLRGGPEAPSCFTCHGQKWP
jgi:hypothetical protein